MDNEVQIICEQLSAALKIRGFNGKMKWGILQEILSFDGRRRLTETCLHDPLNNRKTGWRRWPT